MKRLKSFQLYKESYLQENEEDASAPLDAAPEGDATPIEDAPVDGESQIDTDAPVDGTQVDGESEEENPVASKVTEIISANYADTIEDLVNGVMNEMEDDASPEDVRDAIMDAVEQHIETILFPVDSDEDGADSADSAEGDVDGASDDIDGAEGAEGDVDGAPEDTTADDSTDFSEEEEEVDMEEEEEDVDLSDLDEEEEEEEPVTENKKVVRRK